MKKKIVDPHDWRKGLGLNISLNLEYDAERIHELVELAGYAETNAQYKRSQQDICVWIRHLLARIPGVRVQLKELEKHLKAELSQRQPKGGRS